VSLRGGTDSAGVHVGARSVGKAALGVGGLGLDGWGRAVSVSETVVSMREGGGKVRHNYARELHTIRSDCVREQGGREGRRASTRSPFHPRQCSNSRVLLYVIPSSAPISIK
jgi:hypothetical protein